MTVIVIVVAVITVWCAVAAIVAPVLGRGAALKNEAAPPPEGRRSDSVRLAA